MAWDEVLAAHEQVHDDLVEMEGVLFELLMNCRVRKQQGPPELANMPPAPTVIQQTLWIPWVTGSATWMLADLFPDD